MTTAIFLAGLAAVIAAGFLWTIPAGVAAAGVSLCLVAVGLERAREGGDE